MDLRGRVGGCRTGAGLLTNQGGLGCWHVKLKFSMREGLPDPPNDEPGDGGPVGHTPGG